MQHVTSENMASLVSQTFRECIFNDYVDTDTNNKILVSGSTFTYSLNKRRLEEHRNLIKDILDKLPDSLKDGDSFSQFFYTKNYEKWTNLPKEADDLLVLSIGLGLAEITSTDLSWTKTAKGNPCVKIL